MNIRTMYVGGALAILLVIVLLASLFLSRRSRLWLYTILILSAVGVWGYTTYNLKFLVTPYSLEVYASGFFQPVFAAAPPGNDGRLFVIERAGKIIILQDGVQQETPFLDITDKVVSDGGEQGLLSMAFHPQFAENGRFFIYYTRLGAGIGDTFLEQYQVSANDPQTADPNSAITLLQIEQPDTHHNGGQIAFGPDGYLYLGIGEADSNQRGGPQSLSSLWGKLLRLDVDRDMPYAIPPDNPFVNTPEARPEIWAYGLRNPWRFAFDSQTGDLYIADVGNTAREEIDFQPAGVGGSNYGWNLFEGTEEVEAADKTDLIMPIYEYDHKALGGCAIIGGYVYRGQEHPDLQGKYLFSDYCTGFIWALTNEGDGRFTVNRLLRQEQINVSSFAVDQNNEVYIVDIRNGALYQLVSK